MIASECHRPPPIPGADWFTEEVRRQLLARFGQDTTTQGGLMVRTSLDPALQLVAERSLRDGLTLSSPRKITTKPPFEGMETANSFEICQHQEQIAICSTGYVC